MIPNDRRFADLRPFLEHVRQVGFRPNLIVDVGANRGQWTELALEIFPASRFLLVEPQPEMETALDELCRRQRNVRWVQAAAGARDEIRLQTIWPDLQGSSFLPLEDPRRIATGEQRPVRLERLDDLLQRTGHGVPDLVKLDVQGFELEVLRGAPSILGRTELFILETSLYRFLPGIPLLREVVQFMAEHGYEVYDVPGYIWRPVDGALGQLDVAFARAHGDLRQHDRW
jgi:FkbM family methyltransferase